MYSRLRPLLFLLPPELAHAVTLRALRALPSIPTHAAPIKAMGLRFPNRVGLAAGFDKTGAYADGLAKLGFGFVETGTFTPLPQAGNPKPRLFRIPRAESLLNCLGFNNPGAEAAAANLRALHRKEYVLGINIGKGKDTPISGAGRDYVKCLEFLYDLGDYFTVNISSPNTEGLRSLEEGDGLASLLKEVVRARDQMARDEPGKPILVKLSPDIPDVGKTCSIIAGAGVNGVIASNTSLLRPGEPSAAPDIPTGLPRGGLSGKAISERSMRLLEAARDNLPDECTLVACGGISSPDEARRRIDAGADLIQLYTGMVYKGPGLVPELVSAVRDCA